MALIHWIPAIKCQLRVTTVAGSPIVTRLIETIFGPSHFGVGAADTGDGKSRVRRSLLATMAERQGKEH